MRKDICISPICTYLVSNILRMLYIIDFRTYLLTYLKTPTILRLYSTETRKVVLYCVMLCFKCIKKMPWAS